MTEQKKNKVEDKKPVKKDKEEEKKHIVYCNHNGVIIPTFISKL